MKSEKDISPEYLVCAMFRSEDGPDSFKHLGPAALIDPAIAVLDPALVQGVNRAGLNFTARYWLVAGVPGATAEDLFVAPAIGMRVAEAPDPAGIRHVAVALGMSGWKLPGDAEDPEEHSLEALLGGEPCTEQEAKEIGAIVAQAAAPDGGWLAAAGKALADRPERKAIRQLIPIGLPKGRRWPRTRRTR